MRTACWSMMVVLVLTTLGCGDDDDAAGSDTGLTDTGTDNSGDTGTDDNAVAKAAVVWGSCLPDDGIAAAALTMAFPWEAWDFPFDLSGVMSCLATATDGCNATWRCAHVRAQIIRGTCDPHCTDEGYYIACDDNLEYTMDCPQFGLVCDPDIGCTSAATQTCTETDTSTCGSDGNPTYCDWDGILWPGPDCDAFGLTCEEYEGASVCQGPGDACSPDGWGPLSIEHEGVACVGNVLRACVNGGLREIDCTTLGAGMACQEAEGVFFCGLAAQCEPFDRHDHLSCDGATVEFCYLGRLEQVDCTTLGFTGCDVTTYLGCTPFGGL